MARRKSRQDDAQRAWNEACRLHAHLASGGHVATINSTFVGSPGEQIYGDLTLNYSRFYGTTVEYSYGQTVAVGSPGFVVGAMVGNVISRHHARRRAEQLAAPQWREHSMVRTVVTDQRLWCHVRDGRWLNFDYDAIVEAVPDVRKWWIDLFFQNSEPLRLAGLWAPWCAVVVMHHRYGRTVAMTHPGLPRIASG